MGLIVGTMKFKEELTPQKLTWVESHAYTPTGATLPAAITALKTLANLRVQMLGAGVVMTELFVSDLSIWRDSSIEPPQVPFRDKDGLPVYNPNFRGPNASYPADFAYSSCKTRLEASDSVAGDLYRRTYWLSGNPDAAQDIQHRTPAALAMWQAAWNAFINVLVGRVDAPSAWGMMVRARTGGANVEKQIFKIDPTTGILTVLDPLAGINVGDQVIVRNCTKLTPRPAGICRVTAKTPITGGVTLSLARVGTSGGGNALAGVYKGKGWIRKYTPTPMGYTFAEVIAFGSKRRGDSVDRGKGKTKKRPAVIGH